MKCVDQGNKMPTNIPKYKENSYSFFNSHPVFSIREATEAFNPPRGRRGMVDRLKHHVEKGRLVSITKGIYAVVPGRKDPGAFHPDPFLSAAAIRGDAVFSHHSALELLGASHSDWNQITLFTQKRRRPLSLARTTILFLEDPGDLAEKQQRSLGIRKVERLGKVLSATGPERTLVEGFRRPGLAGGLEELIESAAGFPVLDLALLEEVLGVYDAAYLWAAAGWFLERFQRTFYVPNELLGRLGRRKPRSPRYLEKKARGGWLASRWNLILPDLLRPHGETGEPQP